MRNRGARVLEETTDDNPKSSAQVDEFDSDDNDDEPKCGSRRDATRRDETRRGNGEVRRGSRRESEKSNYFTVQYCTGPVQSCAVQYCTLIKSAAW